jgi:peptidoglycan/xylan/chitin deacetylase (PgdA/CDA1 family)
MMWWALARIAKCLFESVLTSLGVLMYHAGLAGTVIRLSRRPRVLMYHACEECESDFTRGLAINTTPALFEKHLEFLTRHYRIVPLATLVGGHAPERAVVITFDDGFRSVHEHAFPLLKSRGLPATCYLVTNVIEDRALIWILALNWYLERHRAVAGPLVARGLGVCRRCSKDGLMRAAIARYSPGRIAELMRELRAALGPVVADQAYSEGLFLRRADIDEMSRGGFSFGNHTASHVVLPNLDVSACREEIATARALLAAVPESDDSLAYPFGLYNPETARIARELGYTTLLLVEGDNQPFDPHHIGRLNVTSISPARLFARMELTAPLTFRIKRLAKRAPAALRSRFGLGSPPWAN